jgi:hypothetical protein
MLATEEQILEQVPPTRLLTQLSSQGWRIWLRLEFICRIKGVLESSSRIVQYVLATWQGSLGTVYDPSLEKGGRGTEFYDGDEATTLDQTVLFSKTTVIWLQTLVIQVESPCWFMVDPINPKLRFAPFLLNPLIQPFLLIYSMLCLSRVQMMFSVLGQKKILFVTHYQSSMCVT